MSPYVILLVTVAVGAAAILAEVVYSRLARVRKERLYRLSDTFVNFSAAAFEHVFTVLVAVPVYELYAAVYRHRAVDAMPAWLSLPVAILFVDLGFYLWHRASHRVGILWFGHAIHHSSEEFNLSVAVRSSGWARLTQRFFYLPMAILGVPVAVMVLADALSNIYALFLHNRFVPKLGFLERIFVTPSHHRVHHARNPEYLDKNFAAIFIFWDKLFGTFAEEDAEPIFGLTKPLATHNVAWARFHVLAEIGDRVRRSCGLGQKLLAPFRPPEWDPDGVVETTQPASSPRPLEVRASRFVRVYAYGQHVVAFAAVFAFTFVAEATPLGLRLAVALWLCASLAIAGALLDGRKWAVRAEALRWTIALACAVVMTSPAS